MKNRQNKTEFGRVGIPTLPSWITVGKDRSRRIIHFRLSTGRDSKEISTRISEGKCFNLSFVEDFHQYL